MHKFKKDLTEEEVYLYEAIMAARFIQEYLWGEYNNKWGIEEWKRMFKKRMVKIDDIDPNNPHALIELKKRVLQNTALGIALLKRLEDPVSSDRIKRDDCDIPSNLPEYR